MPARLDRVEVQVGDDVLVIPWAARDAILGRLPDTEAMQKLRADFLNAGASRPVRLPTREQRDGLLDVLDGFDVLPDGLTDLRAALASDLGDA